MKKILFFISSLLLAIGCRNKPDITPAGNMKSQSGNISGTQRIMGALLADHPADINATVETKNLYLNMKRLSLKGVMFGHEDDLATGVGWTNTPGRSDVQRRICIRRVNSYLTRTLIVADYVDSDPGNTHFTSIGSTGAGTIAAINSGKLPFDRTGGADNGYFSRTKDFAPVRIYRR